MRPCRCDLRLRRTELVRAYEYWLLAGRGALLRRPLCDPARGSRGVEEAQRLAPVPAEGGA